MPHATPGNARANGSDNAARFRLGVAHLRSRVVQLERDLDACLRTADQITKLLERARERAAAGPTSRIAEHIVGPRLSTGYPRARREG